MRKAVAEHITSAFDRLPYGSRKNCVHLHNLSRDIKSGKNALALSAMRWGFGQQDFGISNEEIWNGFEVIRSLLESRRPSVSLRPTSELLALETRFESESNPVQWALGLDLKNGFLRRKYIEYLEAVIPMLQELLARLRRDEADDARKLHQ